MKHVPASAMGLWRRSAYHAHYMGGLSQSMELGLSPQPIQYEEPELLFSPYIYVSIFVFPGIAQQHPHEILMRLH